MAAKKLDLNDVLKAAHVTPEESRPKRFEIITADKFMQPQPPIEWVVDGLISTGSVNVFYGEAGCGKTWALLDLAVCAAMGKLWLGMRTKAGSVLIIDEESGQRRLSRRMGEIMRGHNADNTTPINAVSLAALNLGEANDIGELTNLIIGTGASLTIIDALADIMPGRDENSVKDTAPIFLTLRRIAEETQCSIIVIHHSNKTGGYRGSSAIKGAIDLLLSVEKKNDSNHITFRSEKARDTTAGAFAAEMNFDMLNSKFWLTAANFEKTKQAYSKGERYVIKYLSSNGESAVNDIVSNADACAPSTARTCIYGLVDRGIVERTNQGGRGTEATFRLTEKGTSLIDSGEL